MAGTKRKFNQFASASVAVPDLQTAVNSTVPAGTDNAQPAGTEDPNKPKRAKCSIEDYNRRAETKVKTSRRTGQACNRCRGRKARCDMGPNGCTNCIKAGVVCEMVDRIRGVSAPRGALQAAQEENARLQAENERLMLENEQLHNELARYRATYPELPANNDQSNQPKTL
ncbi:hypothetical protein ASPWEDRAFT_510170 [Aspergillus wentii DTO 134E9]|uniref:Zn(2)-C6 fungal-type domain-containing protein n=1 Tax=Aspergillus wentii DTO 134E9 TaxID=1073089 RepID=A0A1L9RKM3_ASPWE|nr:uncharacterized protein ASPWEDRAFT_510170 [Aspergillus wentii DTO 134E9]OJJ35454.1 hypothetical protein ASPWEDRAFT_510170 [Aspergillus wentii DTO 134E9]